MEKKFIDDLLIVIVLYKCTLYQSTSYNTLLKNKELVNKLHLFVFDNSPTCRWSEEGKQNDACTIESYIHCLENIGLSSAYNQACSFAEKNGYKYLLLLDQDTTLNNTLLEDYQLAISKNPQIYLFAPILKTNDGKILSPCKYKFGRGFSVKHIEGGIYNLQSIVPVNSGILIYVNKFLEVGGYNKKVRLDFSDFQFIERYKKKYKYFFVTSSVCMQAFSNQTSNKIELLERYKIYCECGKACDKESFFKKIYFFSVVFLRGAKLVFRTGSITFFRTFFQYYL